MNKTPVWERMHKTQIRLIQLVYQSKLLAKKKREKIGKAMKTKPKKRYSHVLFYVTQKALPNG